MIVVVLLLMTCWKLSDSDKRADCGAQSFQQRYEFWTAISKDKGQEEQEIGLLMDGTK